jgi:nucleotide-binding universal stress UspA family protein
MLLSHVVLFSLARSVSFSNLLLVGLGSKEDLKNMVEEGIRKILEERLKICKEAGKTVDEIVSIEEENDYDLIIMASSRISSSIRLLGSTVKGVIDSIKKPVLIIHST